MFQVTRIRIKKLIHVFQNNIVTHIYLKTFPKLLIFVYCSLSVQSVTVKYKNNLNLLCYNNFQKFINTQWDTDGYAQQVMNIRKHSKATLTYEFARVLQSTFSIFRGRHCLQWLVAVFRVVYHNRKFSRIIFLEFCSFVIFISFLSYYCVPRFFYFSVLVTVNVLCLRRRVYISRNIFMQLSSPCVSSISQVDRVNSVN